MRCYIAKLYEKADFPCKRRVLTSLNLSMSRPPTKIPLADVWGKPLGEPNRLLDKTRVESIVWRKLSECTPREQKILRMRFGLDDGITHTLAEVGREFGVTRERARQILKKALSRMKD